MDLRTRTTKNLKRDTEKRETTRNRHRRVTLFGINTYIVKKTELCLRIRTFGCLIKNFSLVYESKVCSRKVSLNTNNVIFDKSSR